MNRRRRQSAEPCDCLRPLIRIFSIITSFVTCGVGVDVYLHGYTAGLFILLGSIVIFILEIKWIITLFLELLLARDQNSTCAECWSVCRVAGGWRLAPPYIAIGTALILWPHNLWLSYVAGLFLIILALLRLCTIFRFTSNTKDVGLLPQYDFEHVEGVDTTPDDGFAEVIPSLVDEEPLDDIC